MQIYEGKYYSRANHPSSSSRRLGAGNGAPGPSCVGSRTYPESPKGLSDCSFESMGVDELVLAGTSVSRRDQPMEFSESRKDVEAMFTGPLASVGGGLARLWL